MCEDTLFESQMKIVRNAMAMFSSIRQLTHNPLQDAVDIKIGDMIGRIIEQCACTIEQSVNDSSRDRLSDKNNDIGDEIPIYERLSSGEVMILSRDKDSMLVIKNKDGDVSTERIYFGDNN